MRKVLLTLLLSWIAMVAVATPVWAHNVLISSNPGKGSAVDAGPATVTLTFDQYIQRADVNQVAVTGPGGGQWAEGPVQISSNVVNAPLRPLGPVGEYTIGYRVLSADGHPVTGEVKFTLAKPGIGTPVGSSAAKAAGVGSSQATPPGGSGGVPIWAWIAGAVILLGVGMTVALKSGKEKRNS